MSNKNKIGITVISSGKSAAKYMAMSLPLWEELGSPLDLTIKVDAYNQRLLVEADGPWAILPRGHGGTRKAFYSPDLKVLRIGEYTKRSDGWWELKTV